MPDDETAPTTSGAWRVLDGHTHVVSRDLATYPIAPGVPDEHAWYHEHPVDVEDLLLLGEATGVAGAVLVQAISCHGFDNRYVLDAARAHPGRAVAVGAVHPTDPQAAALVRHLALDDALRGVRLMSTGGAAAPGATPQMQAVLGVAAELGLPVLLVGVEEQLAGVPAIVRAFPSVTFVLDHCLFATLIGAPSFPHAGDLLALAPFANVVLKVSSITLQSVAGPAALWPALAARFGAERLLWGSDLPHTFEPGYAGLVDLAIDSTSGLSAPDRAAVLGGNVARLWPELA